MDPLAFDRWTTTITIRRSRRATLGLLSGASLVGLLPRLVLGAQRPDRDYDGLYDDDETDVYGTNPDVFDTDGDGFGDGEEIYFGSDPLSAASYTGVVGDGNDVGANDPVGPEGSIDVVAATCPGPGYACNDDTECCGANVRCCWDGISLRTECTDVSAYGGLCPY